jgi:4-alpha-glucanotransferase
MMRKPFVQLSRNSCVDPEEASRREWWLGNGIGGYAAGTVSGVLTRRYHGLLVAPLYPPLGRSLLFAKADPVLRDGETEMPLHANQWAGGVYAPEGQRSIESFHLEDTLPVWQFAFGDLRVEQRIWMDHGRNQTRVAFRWIQGVRDTPPVLRIGLLASFRDHHAVNRLRGFRLERESLPDGYRLHLPGGRFVEVRSGTGRFSPDNTWIENFSLAREKERGLEDIDHHLRIGRAEIPLAPDTWVGISIALDGLDGPGIANSLAAEQHRLASLQSTALPGVSEAAAPGWVRQLVSAADSYVFERLESGGRRRTSVIAGYPWFGDWGRDTMIALPGLTLATGRSQLAREILETFGAYVSEGMLPNVFPGSGDTPEYNTVDAALWFIEAWRAYVQVTYDLATLAQIFPTLSEIVAAYRDGTRFGISMDPSDGLIRAGVPGQQLTWMDARANGVEVTPRHGKPVEINALWYNALRVMGDFARRLGRAGQDHDRLAASAADGFRRYRREDGAGLFDVLDGPDGNDASVRPNQLFAVSLSYSPLGDTAARREVVDTCRERLLTPLGLRSLAADDPRYCGRYLGGPAERDGCYHQGPVWGWLLGHYVLAEHRVTSDRSLALSRLEAVPAHLSQAGLGHISEIFDGDRPHRSRGTPAQAWSVACTLDTWWRLEGQLRNGWQE